MMREEGKHAVILCGARSLASVWRSAEKFLPACVHSHLIRCTVRHEMGMNINTPHSTSTIIGLTPLAVVDTWQLSCTPRGVDTPDAIRVPLVDQPSVTLALSRTSRGIAHRRGWDVTACGAT